MNEQIAAEQPSGDSGRAPLSDRIENIFSPSAPKPERQVPERQPDAEVQAEPEQQDAPDSEAPQQEAEESFEIEYEGDRYVLPKKLEKGFLQERDYTQKAQQVADQRRQIELREQQFRLRELQGSFGHEVGNELKQIQMIEAVLEQPVNWAQMSSDEAFRHKIQLDDLEKQKNKLQSQVNQKYGQWQQQVQQHEQELLAKSAEEVRRRIPNWSEAVHKAVREHATKDGYSDHELNAVTDPRQAVTLWKAMRYDQLQEKAKTVVPQMKNVKTTSSQPMASQTKELLSYRKALDRTKDPHARRKLVENRIASKFSR